MKPTQYIAIFVTTAVGLSNALPQVSISNNCKFPIYVQNPDYQDYNSNAPWTAMKSGDQISHEQIGRESFLVAKSSSHKEFLEFTYTLLAQAYTSYFILSTDHGNPFLDQHNTLKPSNGNCFSFDCKPGDKECYTYKGGPFHDGSCAKPVALTLTLCA